VIIFVPIQLIEPKIDVTLVDLGCLEQPRVITIDKIKLHFLEWSFIHVAFKLFGAGEIKPSVAGVVRTGE
jgi:hypothetical protein